MTSSLFIIIRAGVTIREDAKARGVKGNVFLESSSRKFNYKR